MPEQLTMEMIANLMMLHYCNRYLYEHGIISEDIFRKMHISIEASHGNLGKPRSES